MPVIHSKHLNPPSTKPNKRKRYRKNEDRSEPVGLLLLPIDVLIIIFGDYLSHADLRNLSLSGNKMLSNLIHDERVWKKLVERREGKTELGNDDKLEKNWKEEYRKGMWEHFELLNTWKAHSYHGDIFLGDLGEGYFVSRDSDIKVWELSSGKCIQTFDSGRIIYCSTIYKGLIVCSFHDNLIKIWNPKTGECVQTLSGHDYDTTSLCVIGDFIASGSEDNTIKIWNPTTGECVQTFNRYAGITDVQWTCMNAYIACNLMEMEGKLVSAEYLYNDMEGHRRYGRLNLLNIDDGTYEKTLRVSVRCMTTLGKNMIVCGDWKGNIIICNMSLRKIERRWKAHENDILSIIVSPDGRKIMSWSVDLTMKIWDIFQDFKCITTLNNLTTNVYEARTLLLIGNKLIISNEDGTINVWGVKDL